MCNEMQIKFLFSSEFLFSSDSIPRPKCVFLQELSIKIEITSD